MDFYPDKKQTPGDHSKAGQKNCRFHRNTLLRLFLVNPFQPQDEAQEYQKYGIYLSPKGVNRFKETSVILNDHENRYEPDKIAQIQCRNT